MDRVYIVCAGEYSDKHIVTVFDNEEDADKFVEVYNSRCTYEDAYVIEQRFGKIDYLSRRIYTVFFSKAYETNEYDVSEEDIEECMLLDSVDETIRPIISQRYSYETLVIADTEGQALKIARDRMAKYKALKEGI